MAELKTPFDHPKRMIEKLMFPSLQTAYRQGYSAGSATREPKKPPVEVVREIGIDDGWYAVQCKLAVSFDEGRRQWENARVFPDTKLDEAEEAAREMFEANHGAMPVRIVHVGKPIKEEA